MFKKAISIILILALLLFSGCAAQKKSEVSDSASKSTSQSAVTNGGAPNAPEVKNQASNQLSDRKIIKNYQVYVTVDDMTKMSDDIEQKAKSMGGYIQNEDFNEYNSNTTVKIPQDKADEFIDYIAKNYEVKNKSIQTEDITQAYTDNDARLKNLKAQESQMLEVLKKANTVEDILRVQAELYKIRGDIESLEATKRLWDKQVDFATITISANIRELVKENKISIINGNQFFSAISKGFVNSVTYLIVAVEKFVIFVVANIIWLIILGLILWVVYKKFYKKRNIIGKLTEKDNDKKN